MDSAYELCVFCKKSCTNRSILANQIKGVSLITIINDLCSIELSSYSDIEKKLHTCEQCVIALLHAQAVIENARSFLEQHHQPHKEINTLANQSQTAAIHNVDQNSHDQPLNEVPTNPTTRNRHQCEICSKEYYSIKLLKRHYLQVHQASHVKLFKCSECDERYTTQAAVERHLGFVHQNKRRSHNHACAHCGVKFFHRSKLDVHMVQHCNQTNSMLPVPDETENASVFQTQESIQPDSNLTTSQVAANLNEISQIAFNIDDISQNIITMTEVPKHIEKSDIQLKHSDMNGDRRKKQFSPKVTVRNKGTTRKIRHLKSLQNRIDMNEMENHLHDSRSEGNTILESNIYTDIDEELLSEPRKTKSPRNASDSCSGNICVFCWKSFDGLKLLRDHLDENHFATKKS